MRLFQNSGVMRTYARRLGARAKDATSFQDRIDIFLNDRYGAPHFLSPILDRDQSAFFTNGDDEYLQRAWARENGMKRGSALDEILLAQIEAHRADVFYNMDPVRYPNSFLPRLPGCVKRKIAWRAAPSGKVDFGAYDLLVCNFPSILADYRSKGWRAEYFFPAHDPEMDAYAERRERPIDVLFVGGYSQHHANRAALLDVVARGRGKSSIVYHLDRSRLTALAETPLGLLGPLARYRRPADIRAVSRPAIFGRELYAAISSAKIVLNGAVDMSGEDRGNMRCWEATGCGAALLSDEGIYPVGFETSVNMLNYGSPDDVVAIIENLLVEPERRMKIAKAGNAMIKSKYSKARQFEAFLALI